MYIHAPFPQHCLWPSTLNKNGQILWKYEPKQESYRHPGDVLRHGQFAASHMETARFSCIRPTQTLVAPRRKRRATSCGASKKTAIRRRGENRGTSAPFDRQGQGSHWHQRRRVSACRRMSPAYKHEGRLAGRGRALFRRTRRSAPGRREYDRARQASRQGLVAQDLGRATSGRLAEAGTWGWISYDPQLNLIYYGSGNPSTWNPVQRPGDNKMVDDHFRPQPPTPGSPSGSTRLTPARPVGLRRASTRWSSPTST